MSTDEATAAFFAKKKGKKKTFKSFNANKVDASSLTTSIYADPVESEANDVKNQSESGGSSSKAAGELLDMKALEEQRRAEDDVASRIALEETRAQLAAAKLNMEKEAQRFQQEKLEKEEAKKKEDDKAKEMSNQQGSKWLPPHLRGSTSSWSGGLSKKDFIDGDAFPDLVEAVSAADSQKVKMPKAPNVFQKSNVDFNSEKYIVSKQIVSSGSEKIENKFVGENMLKLDAPTLAKKKKKKDLSTFKSG